MFFAKAQQQRLATLEARVAELSTACAQIRSQLEKTASARMAAEIEDLRAAVDLSSRSVRRELSRMWRRVGHAEAEAAADPPPPEPETPEAIRARLRVHHPGVRAQIGGPIPHEE